MQTEGTQRAATAKDRIGWKRRLGAPYYVIHAWLLSLSALISRQCDYLTRWAYSLRGNWLAHQIRYTAQWVGGAVAIMKFIPRMPAYRITGPEWSVMYIGDTTYLDELRWLLFPTEAAITLIGRVPFYRLRAAVQAYLTDVDLVVCGLNKQYPGFWRPKARFTFSCPVFVGQELDIQRPLKTLIAGTNRRDVRHAVNRASVLNLSWRITRERHDFDHFYTTMYLPHIQRQHGMRATITAADRQWQDWVMDNGELLLIDLNGRTVAGGTLRYQGDKCIGGDEGVADLSLPEERRYLQTAIKMFTIERARQRGAATLMFGLSLARYSDPVFRAKRRWGATVISLMQSDMSEWTFASNWMPPALIKHINQAGLIAVDAERSVVLWIEQEDDRPSTEYDGIDGILHIMSGSNVFQPLV